MKAFRLAWICTVWVLLTVHIATAQTVVSSSADRQEDPYAPYKELHGDLHVHSSTGSFDAKSCQEKCFSVTEQLAAARAAKLDYVAITEHDLNPNPPNSKMSADEWEEVLTAVSNATAGGFIALAGYEWTSSQKSCFVDVAEHDYNHKIVIFPPGVKDICDSLTCKTPDELAVFVHKRGGIIITPHPWRVLLLDKNDDVTRSVTRNYFAYSGDGPGDVMIGAEVGPSFLKAHRKVLCDNPLELPSRTVTIEEWLDALNLGKHLAAVSSSDRHDSATPFGSRTTSVFVKNATAEGIIEALLARRTHAANLAPFNLRFSVDRQPVGSSVTDPKEAIIDLVVKPGEFRTLEIWLGKTMIWRLSNLPADGRVVLPLEKVGMGPLWVKAVGKELDVDTQTPRTTITSPIWLK